MSREKIDRGEYWQGRSRDEIIAAAVAEFGEVNKGMSNGAEIRIGKNGSTAVVVAGDKAGSWYSHESGEGGYVRIPDDQFANAVRGNGSNGTSRPAPRHSDHSTAPAQDDNKWTPAEAVQKFWTDAQPLMVYDGKWQGTPAAYYLLNRKIAPDAVIAITQADAARYHPAHQANKTAKTFPALILPRRDAERKIVGIQSIRLTDVDDKTTVKKIPGKADKVTTGSGKGVIHFGNPDSKTVFVTEGVEDALSLWSVLGDGFYIAAGGTSGLNYVPQIASRSYVVVADNDQKDDGKAIDALVQTIKCYNRLADAKFVMPCGFKDANEALQAGAADQIKEWIKSAGTPDASDPRIEAAVGKIAEKAEKRTPDAEPHDFGPEPPPHDDERTTGPENRHVSDYQPEWHDPIDFFAPIHAAPLRETFVPEPLVDVIWSASEVIGTPRQAMFVSTIAAASAAIDDRIVIQPFNNSSGWTESARLWNALIGPPSVAKTPSFKFGLEPLRKASFELQESAASEMDDYRLKIGVYKKLVQKYEKAMANQEEFDKPVKPEHPVVDRLIVNDVTIEALSEYLSHTDRGTSVFQDELSAWFGSMDAYSGNGSGSKDRAHWLQLYNGGPYQIG